MLLLLGLAMRRAKQIMFSPDVPQDEKKVYVLPVTIMVFISIVAVIEDIISASGKGTFIGLMYFSSLILCELHGRRLFEQAMTNSGQVCVAIKRLYVPRSLCDEICDELVAHAEAAIVGDGMDPDCQYGPVQNRRQFDRIKELIGDAIRDGELIAGGMPDSDGAGYFIAPTIVRGLPDDARLVREEQFGPVLPVLVYDDLDDAITRANTSEFGLGASVWSGDAARGEAIAARLQAGTVWVNTHGELSPAIPFRGSKLSGVGTDFGDDGLEGYCQPIVVNIRI